MLDDILVILMVAFGLFAICMFILFYVYLKKHYNNKHMSDDYKKDIDREDISLDSDKKNDEELVPRKKKNK